MDYVLTRKELDDHMIEMVIDESKILCPYREINRKGIKHIVYSDHCPIYLRYNIDIGSNQARKSPKKKVWDLSEEGFAIYREKSKREIKISKATTMTEVYGDWSEKFETLLGNCFRKKTIKQSKHDENKLHHKSLKGIRRLLLPIAKGGKIQRQIVREYVNKLIDKEAKLEAEQRAKRLHKAMEQLSENEKFSPLGYWKMKQASQKNKRKDVDMLSVLKPNGVEVEGAKAILEACMEEFERRLENRKPHPDWVKYTEETNNVIRRWLLTNDSDESEPFQLNELSGVIKTLNNSSPGIDGYPASLFKQAGEGVLSSLLEVINAIKRTKDIPEQWDLVKIIMIYKKKGSKKVLKYYRGIFLTIVISKIFEKLIKDRIEVKLSKITILQAGARRNRGGPDNVFLLRGCIDHHLFTKQSLFITAYDFEQAFDSLWLEDCVLSLSKLGIGKDILQLIYNINKRAKVTIKTPHGLTNTFVTDPIVKQGTVLGPLLCGSSTGELCEEGAGVAVGTLALAALLFVDDIINMTNTIEDRSKAHETALLFAKKKKIFYSGTKCYSLAINFDTEVPHLEIDEENNVVETDEIIYLGDVFNEKGNNDGLIKDRVNRGTKSMITIQALIAENEVGCHTINVLLLLYQSLFLSTMLFNSQTWSKLRVEDLLQLQILQLKYLKRAIGVSSSSPNSQVYLELGVLPIKAEIHKRQLGYLHRILNLEGNDPVHEMFRNMMVHDRAGEQNWWTYVSKIMVKYNIPSNLNILKVLSKYQFKAMVDRAITDVIVKELLQEYHSLKKCQQMKYTSLEMQGYLKELYPSQARIIFMIRTSSLDIKTHRRHIYKDIICRGCGIEEETVCHIVNCGLHVKDHISIDVLDEVTGSLSDSSKCLLSIIVDRVNSFLEKV